MHTTNEMMERVIADMRFPLVLLQFFVNHPTKKQTPIKPGTIRIRVTNGNHHLTYSFMMRKKVQQNM
jgi:hypothetical protein